MKFKFKINLFTIVLGLYFSAFGASAEDYEIDRTVTFRLNITRNQSTKQMVYTNTWSGEYPIPVISINGKKRGRTQITGYDSLRNLNNHLSCTVLNGVYHPWSKFENKQSFEVITLSEPVEIEILNNIYEPGSSKEEDLIFRAGDKLVDEFYFGEGFCIYTDYNTRKNTEFTCLDYQNNTTDFRVTYLDAHEREQWLKFDCKEGHTVFVTDEELLSQKGVRMGRILDFGSVAP